MVENLFDFESYFWIDLVFPTTNQLKTMFDYIHKTKHDEMQSRDGAGMRSVQVCSCGLDKMA